MQRSNGEAMLKNHYVPVPATVSATCWFCWLSNSSDPHRREISLIFSAAYTNDKANQRRCPNGKTSAEKQSEATGELDYA